MTKKQVTASGPSALNTVGQQGTVWIDVTGVMRWGAQSPTGIQRVEQSIVKYATEQENIGFAYFDDEERRFKPATPAMASYVRYIVYGSWIDGNRNYWAGIRNAAAFLPMQLRFARKEAVRRIANAISGNPGRKGAVYAVVKAAIRLVFWSWFFIRWIGELCRKAFQTFGRRQIEEFPQGGAALLVAHYHQLDKRGKIFAALESAKFVPVHIVYDLIPILLPDTVPKHFTTRMDNFLRHALGAGNPVIVNSNAVRSDLARWREQQGLDHHDEDIAICRLNSAFDSNSPDMPIPQIENRKFAVFCSTTEKRKRHDVLVAAWARLVEKFGQEKIPDLVFIGRSHPSGRPAIDAELAKAPQLKSKVLLLTGIGDDQLRWAYRNAVLGLFPSSQEGWGLGVSECLAYGLPVVHSDIPVLHEAAQDLMPSAPVGDADAWAQLLGGLFTNPGKIDALREKIKAEYEPGTPDGFARCIIAHLRTVAERGTNIPLRKK